MPASSTELSSEDSHAFCMLDGQRLESKLEKVLTGIPDY